MIYPRDQFDSDEEWYFSWYLEELKDAGFIKEAVYHPDPFLLSEEGKIYGLTPSKKGPKRWEKALLQDHTYAPDWRIIWSDKGVRYFVKRYDYFVSTLEKYFWGFLDHELREIVSYVDIKGAGGRMSRSSSDISFPINQKWLFAKTGIYVQKIVPAIIRRDKLANRIASGLFPETFTPDRYLLTNIDKRQRVINYQTRSLDDFINQK